MAAAQPAGIGQRYGRSECSQTLSICTMYNRKSTPWRLLAALGCRRAGRRQMVESGGPAACYEPALFAILSCDRDNAPGLLFLHPSGALPLLRLQAPLSAGEFRRPTADRVIGSTSAAS